MAAEDFPKWKGMEKIIDEKLKKAQDIVDSEKAKKKKDWSWEDGPNNAYLQEELKYFTDLKNIMDKHNNYHKEQKEKHAFKLHDEMMKEFKTELQRGKLEKK